jgi:hypothetical protein
MTKAITNELMYEVLKKVQADVAHIREDHGQQLVSLREQLHNMNSAFKPKFTLFKETSCALTNASTAESDGSN